MSGRRRGKPNRGGGRFNKPRGGGGGGGGRKGAISDWGDGDDFSLNLGPTRPHGPPPSRSRGRGSRGTSRGGSQGTRGRRSPRQDEKGPERGRPSHTFLPLQKIHMTSKNQLQVTELLRELQTQEFNDPDSETGSDCDEEEEEFDELDPREEGQFWSTRDDGVEFAETGACEEEPRRRSPEPVATLFALGTLCRYGFDRERSHLVLETGSGDVGETLELLLYQLFSERYGDKALAPTVVPSPVPGDCASLRQEEALALTAIYGERFCQRITDRVWTIDLQLDWLLSAGKRTNSKPKQTSSATQVCKFYLKGSGCKFGSRCRFKHQLPGEDKVPPDLQGPSQPGFSSTEALVYQLEVRFPSGSLYPFQPPLVAFSTNDPSLPGAGRLTLTEFLFGLSLSAAQEGEPVIYTLLSALEEEHQSRELLAATHHKYSVPPCVTTMSRSRNGRSTSESTLPNAPKATNTSATNCNVREKRNEAATAFQEDLEEDDQEEEELKDVGGEEAFQVETESYVTQRKKMVRNEVKTEEVQQANKKLRKEFRSKLSSRHYVSMQHQRQKLPVWEEKQNILQSLQENQVLVVSGMTGCGKTTQIPQFILDESLTNQSFGGVANIICTQPRRISAISVATRVAQERAERLGHSTGYQIRLEMVRSLSTRLMFCTTGVLLRRLEGDTELKGVTHVIVDEVHERTQESDFLLLVLRDLIAQRPDLKVILMSATLNAELFSQYYYNCPTIHIPGRTFPVDQFFLEDAIAKTRYVLEDCSPYRRSVKSNEQPSSKGQPQKRQDLAEDVTDYGWSFSSFVRKDSVSDSVTDQKLSFQDLTVRYSDYSKSVVKTLSALDFEKINFDLLENVLEWILEGDHNYPPGAVLVFLPGLAEIKQLYEQLQSNRMFNNRTAKRCAVYPLHSSLSNEDQQAVFTRPPEGVTKIIISTNIAETSVTIDDVVYVIDSGRMKEKRYDASRSMESLEDVWVSRANALQRKGRAGRVASGVCFHLFTSHCFTHHLAQQQLPEILRAPLEQLCLRVKVLDTFAERPLDSVFLRLIEPPSEVSLTAARDRLCALGALTSDEILTPLGWHLACLPVDVRIGKLMLLGAIFRCLDPALTIAASLAFKSPFVSPWDKRQEANESKLRFSVANSDHLALMQAYKGWCTAAKNGAKAGYHYCRENFLSSRGLQEIACLKRQFAELLSDIGFVKEGLKSRVIERMSSKGTDGVQEATGHEANLNADNIKLMSALLCAALYPNVVQVRSPQSKYKHTSKGAMKMQPKASELHFITKNDGAVHIHPSSVNFTVRHYDSPYLVYHEKVRTSRIFIRDCSMVSVYPMVLFGGGQVNVKLQRGEFIVSLDDGWIRFAAASHQVAELVKELRWELDQLLEEKIKSPSMDLISCPRGSRIIDTIVSLISTQ
ncbi:putative ATP-dependent RNA helicase DHX57 [Denticeps clupeoides]|uniref:Putative ATP-dependent RNA helicase DHX57 n=1 Tax=Denticeps clupeoides TaxID=299321 RepID=A0AAY4EVU8_9TELE|nr:putative ATP-dependent RNA helicase DHX57 [Denticeps clupeoides]XP_028844468.1 putative ATP-dependent RNA helicase DHX57 [Denticeps clupeoides]XP_028844469.1 putative ATP-dependent RNA helicase DHX57 [Denticeps clupeoides]